MQIKIDTIRIRHPRGLIGHVVAQVNRHPRIVRRRPVPNPRHLRQPPMPLLRRLRHVRRTRLFTPRLLPPSLSPTPERSPPSRPAQLSFSSSPASEQTNCSPAPPLLTLACSALFLLPAVALTPWSLSPAKTPARPGPPPPARSSDTPSPAAHIASAHRLHHADRSHKSAPLPASAATRSELPGYCLRKNSYCPTASFSDFASCDPRPCSASNSATAFTAAGAYVSPGDS